ncbi:MAG: hypothetical protein BWK79_11270 [Beggiatoa sp. IS2]|nr:MAG: hypothetical protein BWK79_11270 [Beggiatoa sp. IS2]
MTYFTTSIHLKPCFSKRLAILLIVMHVGACSLLFLLTLSWLLKGSLFLLISASAWYYLRLHVLLLSHPLRECVLHQDTLWLPSGESAQLLTSSYHHSQLIILRAQLNSGKICSLVILPDAVSAETFRHLRVRLQHRYAEDEDF